MGRLCGSMASVSLAKPVREEDLYRLGDQLVVRITKQAERLFVGELDSTILADDEHGIRHGFQEPPEDGYRNCSCG